MKYYVDTNAVYGGNGTAGYPFKRIQEAADIARPGDTVFGHPAG